MFDAAFSFRGRINRLRYFLSTMALGFGAMILVAIAVISVFTGGRTLGAMIVPMLLVLAAAPVFLWISLSLQARRFRDIGLNPLYVIPGWIVLLIVDKLVAMAVPAVNMIPGKLDHQTVLGLALNLAAGLALLFWPSKSDDADDETDDAPARRPARTQPPEPPRAAPIAPTYGAAPAATTFGRRGL